ncbi:MAG: c-type cytochrome [Saprospiraceae bacterium]
MHKLTGPQPIIHLFALCCLFACRNEPAIEIPDGFEIHPEFSLELVASEPLVVDPVAMQFDEYGRAFVLEMPGYPLHDEQSRLIMLEDRDGDGRFDHREVFADSLEMASSFLPYRGGMLVAAPPDLLFLKDTDNDNRSDQREVIMSGFSTGNLQHNYNGLNYGLDNWIYAANGGNSGKPYFVRDTNSRLDLRGDDFRFTVEPLQLERVGESSGGFGLAFDHWGHQFETHNLEHVSHLVFANRYLEDLPVTPRHTLRVISDHEENGLARIYPIGEQDSRVNHPEQSGYFSGSCGITFYGGKAFPEAFNDQLFVADVVLNLVHLDVLRPDGASFITSRMREKVEFLASSDRAFRPVNMTTGPDGALYLLDMHRAVIEHPEWIPDELEANMDLRAGKDQGRIYRIVPVKKQTVEKVDLADQSPEVLIRQFTHPNQWVRMRAQRLLVESEDQSLQSSLAQFWEENEDPLARLHVLWTLQGLGILTDRILIEALEEGDSGLQENAAKIAEIHLPASPVLAGKLIDNLQQAPPRAAMQYLLALSRLDDSPFRANEAKMLTAVNQRLITEAVSDRWIILAAASVLRRAPLAFLQLVYENEHEPNSAQIDVVAVLAGVIGRENNPESVAGLLDLLIRDKRIDPIRLIDAVAQEWDQPLAARDRKLISEKLVLLEENGGIDVLRSTGQLRQQMGLLVSNQFRTQLAQAAREVLNTVQPAEERLKWLELLALDDFNAREGVLYQLLDNRQPLSLQKEALRQLRAANLGELNFDLERRRTLLIWSDPEIGKRAAALFSDAGVMTRQAAYEKMSPALDLAGNGAHGREVFTNVCSSCHRYGELGAAVGPVLTEISRKSKATLLHEIIDPNAAVDTRYLNQQIRTDDGNIYQGIIDWESDTEIKLLMMGGQEVNLRKAAIEEWTSTGHSLMPEGLESGMTVEDMADLLAFLQGDRLLSAK